jgi:hypothetical protein
MALMIVFEIRMILAAVIEAGSPTPHRGRAWSRRTTAMCDDERDRNQADSARPTGVTRQSSSENPSIDQSSARDRHYVIEAWKEDLTAAVQPRLALFVVGSRDLELCFLRQQGSQ